jgi:hypothetical protein
MAGRIILLSFSWLLLAAHFSRADLNILMVISLLIPLILIIRKRWALITVQLLTIAGALEWIRTTWILAVSRISDGEEWARMAIILVSVSIITFIAALLLNSKKVKKSYL